MSDNEGLSIEARIDLAFTEGVKVGRAMAGAWHSLGVVGVDMAYREGKVVDEVSYGDIEDNLGRAFNAINWMRRRFPGTCGSALTNGLFMEMQRIRHRKHLLNAVFDATVEDTDVNDIK